MEAALGDGEQVDIQLGEQVLRNVQIPLLWGSRAISQDRQGHLSVVDLSEGIRVEILDDRPVPDLPIARNGHGFDVLLDGKPLYHYDPEEKTLASAELGLPECQVSRRFVRVGANRFGINSVIGSGIGIVVTPAETSIGAPIPKLLQLVIA
jgi:hypothetical protein